MQDLAFERCDGGQFLFRQGADTVDADSQPHHVKLVLGEALDAGAVKQMPHGHVADAVGDEGGVVAEQVDLVQREGVLGRVFGHAEVGENGLHLYLGGDFQVLDELRKLLGHETQAVHAGVQLDVHGIILQALFPQYFHQFFQGIEVGDAGFHSGFDDFRIEIRTRGKYQDGKGNTVPAQFQALNGIGDGQIIGPGALHHGGEFHRAMPVGIGLYQYQQFGPGLQKGTEIAVVLHRGLQVEFQAGEILFYFARVIHVSACKINISC